ncbi:MAG: anaerobic glycerol-3-phosphate dehydrogenase subunit GlpC [Spirochaetes bacterium]|nr:anaerobic glycerol-3-phosphate dehydrogenase subunit GlpC [Spirochaetota bacterium]
MIKLENISFDHCIKCTVCTIYCPVARVTHLYPGPKQSGPDTERLRIKSPELLDISLKYCSNCKRCEIACPSDVKIADIIQTAKWRYSKKEFRIRDFLLSRTDLMGTFGTMFSTIINFFTHLGIVKYLLDLIFQIPKGRTFPNYAAMTFRKWFKEARKYQNKYIDKVVYFHGCYVNYNYPQLGKDVVKVLNALGKGVIITKEKCCGVPLIANGYIKKAQLHGKHNIKVLSKALPHESAKIVSASSSCSLALKHEYPNLLELDNSPIARNVEYITQYVLEEFEKGNTLKLKSLAYTVAYHSPCHLERMGSVAFTIELLRKIPGLNLKILHSECCGISGTYGFKNEYYAISQAVGSELFRIIDQAQPDFVVTDCETCKWQIEMNTKYKVVHPISLLAQALE